MLTVGVDLAAGVKGTAVALVEWGAGEASVTSVRRGAPESVPYLWLDRRQRRIGADMNSSRNSAIAITGAFVAIAACMSFFMVAEIGNLSSVHTLHAGHPSTVWLEPGAYDFDQDPATGSYPGDANLFSVTSPHGTVRVTGLSGELSVGDVGGTLLGPKEFADGFAPAAQFRITRPGNYRIELLANDEYDLNEVLVTLPYGVVATRTFPWVGASLAAAAVLLLCLLRRRRLEPGPR